MTEEERRRAFAAAARDKARMLPRIQRDTLAEIVRQLQAAQAVIIEALQKNPSESAQRRLRQLGQEVERAMDSFRAAAAIAASSGADAAWQAAIEGVIAPVQAAGVSILGPRIDARALLAAKRFMTDRIADISARTVDRLNATLMQNLIGAQSLSDTITDVQRVLGGATRSRAMMVSYTEVGRAHSVAGQESMLAATQRVPGLRKEWQHSARLHPRITHVEANGQIVDVDKPYIIDGELMMFPRDPNASAANTINCGCLSIPVLPAETLAKLPV